MVGLGNTTAREMTMTVEVLTPSTRRTLRAEKTRLKNRLSELTAEMRQVKGGIEHIDGMLKMSMNGHATAPAPEETHRTRVQKGKAMKKGEGPKWAVLIAGKMKTKMSAPGMVKIARANMPLVWRTTKLSDGDISARLGANLASAEAKGWVKADRNYIPIEWELTAAGWKVYEKEAAWRRKLRDQGKTK